MCGQGLTIPVWPVLKKKIFFNIAHVDKFNEDLKKENIFNKIKEIICPDKNNLSEERKNEINNMNKIENFKELYNLCNDESKKKIKGLITEKLEFSKYFLYNNKSEFLNYKDETEIYDKDYNSFCVNKVLKERNIQNVDEIINFAFESQIGNKLLIELFFTRKLMNDQKGFMVELERNYGIYSTQKILLMVSDKN